MGFISHMNCFREIKYHANILEVHYNNVTNAKSAKLNSNKITFMGKPQNKIPAKYKAFTVLDTNQFLMEQITQLLELFCCRGLPYILVLCKYSLPYQKCIIAHHILYTNLFLMEQITQLLEFFCSRGLEYILCKYSLPYQKC